MAFRAISTLCFNGFADALSNIDRILFRLVGLLSSFMATIRANLAKTRSDINIFSDYVRLMKNLSYC